MVNVMRDSDKQGWRHFIRIEKRLDVPPVAYVLVLLLSLLLVILLCGLVLARMGYHPLEVYKTMLGGAVGTPYNFSETIAEAIPLILCSLGVSVAFRMGIWNIGAEGQFFFGAFTASLAALYLPSGLPRVVMLTVVIVAGFLGGALWGVLAGVLKTLANANEILTTLMLNYVAIGWVDYLVYGPWRDRAENMPYSRLFPSSAMLPVYPGTSIHAALLLGLLAAVVLWVVFKRTTWGYEIKLIGENPQVARTAGINIARNILLVMLVGGGLAGLAGMGDVAGIAGRLSPNISAGYGYTAIIIAWLGRLDPLAIVLVSIFFGGLNNGGYALQMVGLPSSIVTMLQGAILLFVLGGDTLMRYRIRFLGWRRDNR